MLRLTLLFSAVCAFLLLSCRKNDDPPAPGEAYRVTVHNHFNLLEGQYAAFISDADGRTLAWRELPSEGSAELELPAVASTEKLDLTLVKIVTLQAPGTGVTDTTITLSTYTGVPGGHTVHLRDLEFRQSTDLYISFSNLTSLDSIIVHDGLTFVRPRPENQFSGWYRVLHTGSFWVRVRVNGESKWRMLALNNVTTPTVTVNADINLMPTIFSHPGTVQMPFSGPWNYQVYGVIDTAARKFLAMGDLIRAPGGAIPVFDRLDVIKPVPNDDAPDPLPYAGLRVRADGQGANAGNYRYVHDAFYPDFPVTLPDPAFDVHPPTVPLANGRFLAGRIDGPHDALVLSRERAGTPNVRWEVLLAPAPNFTSYRLPDVPAPLASRFRALRDYAFNGPSRVRGESFAPARTYDDILRQRLLNADPLWRARWAYTAKEKAF